jgi:monoamine oxidase
VRAALVAAFAAARERAPPLARRRILIVGAGMSGLAAARQLLHWGHDVLVAEARPRAGGRIATLRDSHGAPIDAGAMISTGDEPNPFALLSRQLGLRA